MGWFFGKKVGWYFFWYFFLFSLSTFLIKKKKIKSISVIFLNSYPLLTVWEESYWILYKKENLSRRIFLLLSAIDNNWGKERNPASKGNVAACTCSFFFRSSTFFRHQKKGSANFFPIKWSWIVCLSFLFKRKVKKVQNFLLFPRFFYHFIDHAEFYFAFSLLCLVNDHFLYKIVL